MIYKTILRETNKELEEKKSRFICSIKRVESEDEAKNYITTIKSKYKDAKHNVFAYVVGENSAIQRYSDDGEPQGTAGIPILEVIKKQGITDVIIVVTRYFGGILLGTGGLTRAYSRAASNVISEAGVVEKVNGYSIQVKCNYENSGKLQYFFSQSNIFLEETIFTDLVAFYFYVSVYEYDIINAEITEITKGCSKAEIIEEDIYFKNNNRLYTNI